MVCHAGVYNWHSMMASDFVRARERPLGALPWGDLSKLDKQSPQRFAANFKTPTLVLHGEKDFRVPVTQGFEYYATLKLKGVPTRLVYFPDENHWVLRPQNSRLWHQEFFAWLEKYVGSRPTKGPAPSLPAGEPAGAGQHSLSWEGFFAEGSAPVCRNSLTTGPTAGIKVPPPGAEGCPFALLVSNMAAPRPGPLR